MNIRLRDLEYFVVLAEEMNYTRAAARLYVAQQAISNQIRQLEIRVGVPLLDRSTRRVELTRAGVAFLEGAKRVLAEADSALEAALHAAGRGHLRVGFLPGAALELTRPILSRFEERHPQVEVHLREGRVGEPSAGLAIGEVDVAILRAQFSSDGISREVLVAEPRVLTLPADHPLADAETVSVDDLLDLPMVTVHTRDRTWHDYWLAIEERGGRRPTTIVEVATFEEQIEAIAAGHGVGITGAASSRLYSRPGLVYRQFTDLEPCAVAVGWRDDDHNPLIASFVETARAVRDSEHAVVELITRGLTV